MRKRTLNQRMAGQYAILVLPGLILFTLGMMIPLCMAFSYSFTSWNGLDATKKWVGLDNYIKLFQDKYVRDAWLFTIKFTVLNTVIQNIAALLLACFSSLYNSYNGAFSTMLIPIGKDCI